MEILRNEHGGHYLRVTNFAEKVTADNAKILGERVTDLVVEKDPDSRDLIMQTREEVSTGCESQEITETEQPLAFPYDYSPLETHRIILGLWRHAMVSLTEQKRHSFRAILRPGPIAKRLPRSSGGQG